MSSKPKASDNASPVLSPEQAIAKYKAESQTQASAANYLELGVAYYLAHRWEDAVRTLEQVIGLDPKESYAYYYLGVLYAAQGQRDKADAALNQLLQVSSSQMLKEQAKARIPSVRNFADLGGN